MNPRGKTNEIGDRIPVDCSSNLDTKYFHGDVPARPFHGTAVSSDFQSMVLVYRAEAHSSV